MRIKQSYITIEYGSLKLKLPLDYKWGKYGWEFEYDNLFLGSVGEKAVKYREIAVEALNINFHKIKEYPALMSTITSSLPRDISTDHLSKDEAWFYHLYNGFTKDIYVGENPSTRKKINIPNTVSVQHLIEVNKLTNVYNDVYDAYYKSVNSHFNLLNCYISLKKFMKKPSTIKLMKLEDTSASFGI